MSLDKFRELHEKDFKALTVIDQASNFNRVLVILEVSRGKYKCLRYIRCQKNWTVEIDWHKASISTVFKWLSFPIFNKRKKIICIKCLPIRKRSISDLEP